MKHQLLSLFIECCVKGKVNCRRDTPNHIKATFLRDMDLATIKQTPRIDLVSIVPTDKGKEIYNTILSQTINHPEID